MSYLFTSESVSEGHPDKVADQISDSLLDHYIAFDPESKVACETLVTTNQVVLAGEVKSTVNLDTEKVARKTINKIGYTKDSYQFSGDSCKFLSFIHGQSPDISQGVDRAKSDASFETKVKEQGAGDQGMMFGYATKETANYMPLGLDLAHHLLRELAAIRKEGKEMTYLGPDAKSQVTIEYSDDHEPIRIKSIVISTHHDEFGSEAEMLKRIRKNIKEVLIPRVIASRKDGIKDLFNDEVEYLINPTGKFVIGGPHSDTGLTGRKIIVDTYGGRGAHGGGAFSGKDPSKVDRSAAYATRHIAKNMVAAGVADRILVQVSYAIGVSEPVGLYIKTYGTSKVALTDGEIAQKVSEIFDLRPYAIEQSLKLRNPIYEETATYGHMGRQPKMVTKSFSNSQGEHIEKEVELFTWEKLNYVDKIKTVFKI